MGCFFTGTFSIILSIAGLIYAGLPGAFGGFMLGALIDSVVNLANVRKNRQYFKSEDFTDDKLILAAYVAKADNNRLLRSEMEYVRRFLISELGESEAQAALLRFRDILDSSVDISTVCSELRQHATIHEKMMILQFLFGFAQADGSIRQDELDAIQYISDLCGVSRNTFEAIKTMFVGSYYGGGYQQTYGDSSYGDSSYGGGYSGSYRQSSSLENDYKILEVSPDATNEEVKKAYRAAAKKHHPDKVSHLGEDVRKAAEKKFAQVNEAYERIKKSRGMN